MPRTRTLRARLVALTLVLLAVAALAIGLVTALLLQRSLMARLDDNLTATGRVFDRIAPGGVPQSGAPDPFQDGGGSGGRPPPGDSLFAVISNGQVVRAIATRRFDSAVPVPAADYPALVAAAANQRRPTSITVGDLGVYRVIASAGDTSTVVVGVSEEDVRSTVTNLVTTELIVAVITLGVGGVIGAIVVRRELRPLERVAATARRVSLLPLDRGEVVLAERVPDADPATEVGQVGAALNRMLDHVGASLQARQDSEMQLRQFVADASHELRTPLAAIRGYAELSRRGPLPDETAYSLVRISSQAERMTTLVEDMLLLARLDAGRPLERGEVDLTRLVLDAVSDAHAAGPDHRWQLDLPEEPVTAPGDASRLTQVVTNLLANARTHTPPGTDVTVTLAADATDARITILDGGPGIPADLLPHVFERFARGSTSRSRENGSTGLGLAIVDAVVAAHGGSVDVESRPGRTAFTVRLPWPPAPRPPRPFRESGSEFRESVSEFRELLRVPLSTRGSHSPTRGALTARTQVRHRRRTAGPPTIGRRDVHAVPFGHAPHPDRPVPGGLPPPPPRTGRLRPRHLALGALLAATAVLYLWGLSASGWANGFYSAAAQAAGTSWKAWFFGSSDAANWITVDKTPAALWVDGLSVRIFGLSSWSILVPQALMGVGSVALLYASVRRTTASTGAALLAGAALALTPVAVLIFRFNNPDALLTLLLIGAAYATLRAVEKGGTRWLVLAGTLVGFGFLSKMLQAFLVLPAFALVWLVVAPVGIGKRLRGVLAATVALVVSAGWWVLAVELWPAADRPFIGGSQTNSVLELVFGYNGLGRLTGDEVGSVGGGAGGNAGGWGETGLARLFGSEFGGGAAWLLPAALLLIAVLLWWTRRTPRTDAVRAATLVWGGWLVVTALTFSLMAGIIHPYYVVVLAPAIAALVGIGGAVLWRDRATPAARASMAVLVAVTAGWAFVLLRRTSTWQPWIAWTVLAVGALAAVGLLVAHRGPRLVQAAVLTAAVVAGLLGPAGYSVATAAQAHTGAIPSAGPAGSGFGGGRGGPGGFRPGGAGQAGGFGQGGASTPGQASGGIGAGTNGAGGTSGTGTTGGTSGTGSTGGTTGGAGGTSGTGTTGGTSGTGTTGGTSGTGTTGGMSGTGTGGTTGGTGAGAGGTTGGTGGSATRTGGAPGGGGFGGRGGMGGLLGSPTPSAALVTLLEQDASSYTWAAAAVGSNTAAGYQLATQLPVMAVGGFNGTDPSPTLAQFQQLVAEKKIHWFVGGATIDSTQSGGSDAAQQIAQWVQATFPAQTVGGTTLYDLS